MIIDLSLDKINAMNLSNFKKYIEKQQDVYTTGYFMENAGKEHYKLLAYLSKYYHDDDLIDLGTYRGLSALSMAYNPNNRVHTFDIGKFTVNNSDEEKPEDCNNANFIIDNILENPNKYNGLLKNAKLICLDVDPHDGIKEPQFMDIIVKSGFKGIIVCDDINLNKHMHNWWNNVSLPKYDVSKYGHWSGTGIISTDPNINVMLL